MYKNIIVTVIVAGLFFPAFLSAQTVVCDGLVGGGSGTVSYDGQLRDYVYRVTAGAAQPPLDTVFIGTHDADLGHYTAICMPNGWSYAIIAGSPSDYDGPTAHGTISPGPDGYCPYMIMFHNVSGPQLSATPTDFGFNYYGYPHDVSWTVIADPPVSADWAAVVGDGLGPVHSPRCDTLCETGTSMTRVYAAGIHDNFALPTEPSSPSPDLLAEMQNISAGADPNFDSQTPDRCFGHTFAGWNTNCCINGAVLCFKVTPLTAGASNDNFLLRENAVTTVWASRIGYLKAYQSGIPSDTLWQIGDTLEICLDLANLPLTSKGGGYYFPTNILAALQDGDLDVLMQDDSKIDYLDLTVRLCCDTCYATGDIDGDGQPLTLADMTELIDFVHNRVLPAGPLYECDLNGDDYVDQLDIDIFTCFIAQGITCFPIYPVPTDCDPDTICGACCQFDSCTVKSSTNCALVSGAYLGDGTQCEATTCMAQYGACCWPDGSCTQVANPIDECTALGGIWHGVNIPCTPNPCPGPSPDTGACCFPDGTCMLAVGPADCAYMSGGTGTYFPGIDCTPNPCGDTCVEVPTDLLSWWPLDEPLPNVAWDIGGARNGQHINGIQFVPGQVRNAYRFDWNTYGIVRVWNDPFYQVGGGDFSIDAWVYPEDLPIKCQSYGHQCLNRIILDNHAWGGSGVTFFIKHDPTTGQGRLALRMNMTNFVQPLPATITSNAWHHVAVTVSRSGGTPLITFYLDGQALPTTFTPLAGDLFNNSGPGWPRMDIGHASPLNSSSCQYTNEYFSGRIDELQIFDRVLTPTEIFAIFNAGAFGKCTIYCHLPRKLIFCPSDVSQTITLNLFNETQQSVPVFWGIGMGVCPPGITGNFSGTFSFGTGSPSMTLVPGPNPTSVVITKDPSFGPGDIACYCVWVQDIATGDMHYCCGSIYGVSDIDCPIAQGPYNFTVTPLYPDSTAIIKFPIFQPAKADGYLPYEISAIYQNSLCGCDSFLVDSIVSLNDMTPGMPVVDSIAVTPGVEDTIAITARLTEFKPFHVAEIILKADWDGDGAFTEGASAAVYAMTFADCNGNGIDDSLEIDQGSVTDTNSNWIPDECEYSTESEWCYLYGDASGDSTVNIADAVYLINYIFKSGPAPDPMISGDATADCAVNIGDAVYIINYIFKEGDPPLVNWECTWP